MPLMFRRLLRRRDEVRGIATTLYGAIVAQARRPAFYSGMEVPDTVNGRFEMVALHLFLLLDRLDGSGEPPRETGQEVFDIFCADMDRSLRELGVGDLSVPKRVKRMAEGYYGRAAAYRDPVKASDASRLAVVLRRNVYAGHDSGSKAAILASYVLGVAGGLGQLPTGAIMAGEMVFPDPASFLNDG